MDRSLYREWGRRVREARGTFWTQAHLAEVCGISPGALCKIELGKTRPTDTVKLRLAGALRKRVGELFPWPDEIPPFPNVVRAA